MSAGTELVPVERADAAVDVVSRRVAEAEAQADALQVSNDAEAQAAAEVLRNIARYKKDAEAERKELVSPLNATVKRINQKFKDAVAPFEAADKRIRAKVGTYQAEQDRLRREEEERLERERQERERKAREERERQEAEARVKREAAEQEAREADELAKAETDAEMAKLAEEAKHKAEEAKTAEAAIESLPEPTLPKAVVPVVAKPNGVSTRMVWKATLIDKTQVPVEFLIVDEGAINAAMRDGIRENGGPPEIPGVKFEQVQQLAVRA